MHCRGLGQFRTERVADQEVQPCQLTTLILPRTYVVCPWSVHMCPDAEIARDF